MVGMAQLAEDCLKSAVFIQAAGTAHLMPVDRNDKQQNKPK